MMNKNVSPVCLNTPLNVREKLRMTTKQSHTVCGIGYHGNTYKLQAFKWIGSTSHNYSNESGMHVQNILTNWYLMFCL